MPKPRTSTLNQPWIEIDGTRYPLLADQEVQRRAMTQFAGANQIGPNERPSVNPALSTIVFGADTRRGMGTHKHKVLDGIDTFRYSWGFDTRFEGGFLPCPEVEALTAAPLAANGGAWPTAFPTLSKRVYAPDGTEKVYWYSPGHTYLFVYSVTGNSWTAVARKTSDLHRWRSWVVITDSSASQGIYTSTDGTSFTRRDTSSWRGLADFGNRLWSYNASDGKLYSCIDPTLNIGGAAGCWVPQSEVLYLENIEYVVGLLVYRDKGGNPALFVRTNYRTWGFDDEGSGEFEVYEDFRDNANIGASGHILTHVWMRDKLLYALPFGAAGEAGRHVYQFSGNVNEVGPTSRGGYSPLVSANRFRALSGNVHWLYAAMEGDDVHTAGEVVAFNDLGGWHTIYHPYGAGYSETNPIVGVCAAGDNVYTMFEDGTFEVIRDKDDLTVASQRYAAGEIAPGTCRIYFGRTDEGLPNHIKIAKAIRITLADRTALPTGYEILAEYTEAPGVLSPTSIILDDTTVFPVAVPLPDGDYDSQEGVAHREIEVDVYLYDSVANTMSEVVVIEEVALEFKKWDEPAWAYQLVIDLREETFRKFADSTNENRGLGVLREALEAAVRVKGFHRIKYGGDEWEVDLKATDLVLQGRESPVDGSGLFPITFRDVTTATPSG